jgi:lysine-specific demethylase/histidyl-hydroxylase NO66
LAPRVVPGNRPAPLGPLAQAAAWSSVSQDSVVVARRHLSSAVSGQGERVVVTLPDRRLELPAAAGKAVRAMLEGTPVRVADLPGLDAADALVLVRRLVREGVVVPADEAPDGPEDDPDR